MRDVSLTTSTGQRRWQPPEPSSSIHEALWRGFDNPLVQVFGQCGVNANFVEGSADHLAFPDASFDVVFCTLMLHHLPSPMQLGTIAEMRRVLRPEGRIVIVDMQR